MVRNLQSSNSIEIPQFFTRTRKTPPTRLGTLKYYEELPEFSVDRAAFAGNGSIHNRAMVVVVMFFRRKGVNLAT